jgi:hypothetical protein
VNFFILQDIKDERTLGENLLVENLSHHKIRHIGEKIEMLNPNDPLVQRVLSKFCPDPR